jgi:hypothetical protein
VIEEIINSIICVLTTGSRTLLMEVIDKSYIVILIKVRVRVARLLGRQDSTRMTPRGLS